MVSLLHSSVLGTNVPNVVSTGSIASTTAVTSSVTTSNNPTTSSYDSVSISSTGRMMAAEGNHPPDFDSMSTEDFRSHLVELQEKMADNGVDISTLNDPSAMSEDDLNALKDEMSSMGKGGPRGKQGPPPPPPPSETYSTTSSETDTLEQILEALKADEDENMSDLMNGLLGIQA